MEFEVKMKAEFLAWKRDRSFIDLFKDCISEYDKGVSLNDDHIDIPLEEKMLELDNGEFLSL